MLAELTEKAIQTIRDAARRLTGAARREFEAGVAIDYCQGSPRRAETVFGWGRATVQAGLDQWQTGVGRHLRQRPACSRPSCMGRRLLAHIDGREGEGEGR